MKTMKIRDFLRGGYKDITEMTVITHHGSPIATWNPQRTVRPRDYEFAYRMGYVGGDLLHDEVDGGYVAPLEEVDRRDVARTARTKSHAPRS